jgi:hypothetical protein
MCNQFEKTIITGHAVGMKKGRNAYRNFIRKSLRKYLSEDRVNIIKIILKRILEKYFLQ